jgi:double-stranded uracil-DNA glycosylase
VGWHTAIHADRPKQFSANFDVDFGLRSEQRRTLTSNPFEKRSQLVMADALDEVEVYAEVGLISYESDILAKGLDVIFCGLNPASSAAIAGHNFSNGTNRFWTVLHLAGFTDVRLQPQDERRLLEYGCGITAVVRRPTERAAEVSPEEFRQARVGFEAKMRHYAPRSIAFLGKRALATMIGRPDVAWGRLPTEFAGTMAWTLPNPSGLNRGFTLDALVSAYQEFRIALAQSIDRSMSHIT